MLEFRAFQSNQELIANPKSLIQVDYASPFGGSEYDLFYLDPENEKWDNLGKDSIREKAFIPAVNLSEFDSLKQYPTRPKYLNFPFNHADIKVLNYDHKRKKKMVRSIKNGKSYVKLVSGHSRRIKRDTSNKVYSELKQLNRLKWDLDFSDNEVMNAEKFIDFKNDMYGFAEFTRTFSSSSISGTFDYSRIKYTDDFWLEPNLNNDNFNFVFATVSGEIRIPVVPRNLPKRAEVAQRRINSFYKKYKKALDERKQDWVTIDERFNLDVEEYYRVMENYDELMKKYEEELKKYNELSLNELKTFAATEDGVIRSFQLSGFGTFNFDIRYRMENSKPLLAKLEDSSGVALTINRLYVLDKANNGVLTFNTLNEVFFDSNSTNSLIAILPDQRVGVLSSEKCAPEKLTSKEHTAVLDIFDMNSITINELRKNANIF